MEWISVKDRFPETETEIVIAYANREWTGDCIICQPARYIGGEWFPVGDRGPLKRVTHWMSLPEPPKM